MKKLTANNNFEGFDYFGVSALLDTITIRGRGFLLTREAWKDSETGDFKKAIKKIPSRRRLISFLNRDVKQFCKNHIKTKEKLLITLGHSMMISEEEYNTIAYYHPQLTDEETLATDWLILATPRFFKKAEMKILKPDSFASFSYTMAKHRAEMKNKADVESQKEAQKEAQKEKQEEKQDVTE